ncbi:ribulose-phosphate 3-epimerase, partial [Listeria monocytogenes]|nr:ribulose-phosphate 3-epimerase [Listeria monocytogenes]
VPETAKICKDAGADVFVAGSYIYGAENPVGQIERLKEALN